MELENRAQWDGDTSRLPNVGDMAYDPTEGWGLRVAAEDTPFSCGFGCCGTAEYAVVQISAAEAADRIRDLMGGVCRSATQLSCGRLAGGADADMSRVQWTDAAGDTYLGVPVQWTPHGPNSPSDPCTWLRVDL